MSRKAAIALTIIALLMISSVGGPEAGMNRDFLIPADSSSYEVYKYPENGGRFSVPYGFEVKFKIRNGKYFYLELEDVIGNNDCNYDVHFYDEDGEKIAKQNFRRINETFNIPQNKKSLNCEHLYVRIINNGRDAHRNFRFVTAVPKAIEKGKARDAEESLDKFPVDQFTDGDGLKDGRDH